MLLYIKEIHEIDSIGPDNIYLFIDPVFSLFHVLRMLK